MRWLVPIACAACAAKPAPRREVHRAPAQPRVVELSVYGHTACARLDTDRVRCWGQVAGRVAATPVELQIERVTGVEVGEHHIFVVTSEGTLSALSIDDGPLAAPRAIMSEVTRVSFGGEKLVVLERRGTVVRFPDVAFERPSIEPMLAPRSLSMIRALDGAYCGIDISGGFHCWAGGGSPVTRLPLTDAVAFAGGDRELCVRRATDRLVCWQPPAAPQAGVFKTRPLRPFATADGSVGIAWIAAMREHACELSVTRQVTCAGVNRNGQVGTGSRVDEIVERTEVALDAPAEAIAVGARFSCARLADGDVACWGRNALGTIGDGTLIDRPSPVRVAHLRAHKLPPSRDGHDALPPPSLTMDWSDLPATCTRPERAVAFGRSFPYVSAYVSVFPYSFFLTLASYQLDDLDEAPRGPQEAISVHFQDPLRPSPGVYPAGGQTLIMVTHSRPLAPPQKVVGTSVTITHADAAWMCGEVEVAGGTIPFVARVRR